MSHPNARLTTHGRRLLADRIEAGWTITAAARAGASSAPITVPSNYLFGCWGR